MPFHRFHLIPPVVARDFLFSPNFTLPLMFLCSKASLRLILFLRLRVITQLVADNKSKGNLYTLWDNDNESLKRDLFPASGSDSPQITRLPQDHLYTHWYVSPYTIL